MHWLFENTQVTNWVLLCLRFLLWYLVVTKILRPASIFVYHMWRYLPAAIGARRDGHVIHQQCSTESGIILESGIIHCENCIAVYRKGLREWYPQGACTGRVAEKGQTVAKEGTDGT